MLRVGGGSLDALYAAIATFECALAEGWDYALGMTDSLDEKAWIFWQKVHAQATKEPVFFNCADQKPTIHAPKSQNQTRDYK